MKTYTSMKVEIFREDDTAYDLMIWRERFTPVNLDLPDIISHFVDYGKPKAGVTERGHRKFAQDLDSILRQGEWGDPRETKTATTLDVADSDTIARITLRHHAAR